jgi:NADH-quinone oxidoreductase subunit N
MNLLPTVNYVSGDLLLFLPELIVTAAIVVLLLLRMFRGFDRVQLGWCALILTLFALAVSAWQWVESKPTDSVPIFAGMIVYDSLTNYLRVLLLSATAITILLTLQTGIPDREDSADFHVLLLGGTLGMLLMSSAYHLLMAYIAVEMASLPSYALAGFLKGRRQSSEAALKYVVYGGGASGVMLYGISLLAGRFGTAYLPDLATAYASVLKNQATTGGVDALLVLGTLFILIGLAFKLSAVPFHFWCPDVFEGAAAEVAAFLSVASKSAAFALTARILLVLSATAGPDTWLLARYFGVPLAFLAALTATFGNLAAYPQNNLKRLLAYSTIAHAGYMLMGLAVLTAEGARSVVFYLATYVFMNLGAFAVVAFLRNRTGSEDLRDFRGLIYRAPGLVVLLAIFLLSLLGMPPLAGFVAKFQVFAALFHGGQEVASKVPWLSAVYYGLLVIGGVNTVFSLFYYVRVLKVMILEKPLEEIEGRPATDLGVPTVAVAYTGVLALVVLALGIVWNPLAEASDQSVRRFAPLAAVQARPLIPAATKAPAEKAPPKGARGGKAGNPKGNKANKDGGKQKPKDDAKAKG